jgi:hypothetical protein
MKGASMIEEGETKVRIPKHMLRKIQSPYANLQFLLHLKLQVSTCTFVGNPKDINEKYLELEFSIDEAGITRNIPNKGGKDCLYKFFDESTHNIERSFIDRNQRSLNLRFRLWTMMPGMNIV